MQKTPLVKIEIIQSIADLRHWMRSYGWETRMAYTENIKGYPEQAEFLYGWKGHQDNPLEPTHAVDFPVFVAVPSSGQLDIRCLLAVRDQVGDLFVPYQSLLAADDPTLPFEAL